MSDHKKEMPLTASELGLGPLSTYTKVQNSHVQVLAERISGKMATALANNVGQAFSYLRNEIHNRKLYVMFEQLLACDPKTDHEAPKDVYPIYSASVDTAELMIMEHGMEAMRHQLRDGIEEHFIEHIRTCDHLELQHDKMSRQIYSLTRRIGELTEILQTILAEKATSTKRNQLKIHELNNIISGFNRSSTAAQGFDIEYTSLRDTSLLTQARETEQLQREIESKNITIAALRSKMQLLSNQLTETKARTRSILTQSFSRQSLDIHITQPYRSSIESEPRESPRKTSADSERIGGAAYNSEQLMESNSMMMGLTTTPRSTQDPCKLLTENQSETSLQPQQDKDKQNDFIDSKRQSCVPPPFKFSSPILRKWQAERQFIRCSNPNAAILTSDKDSETTNGFQQTRAQQAFEQPYVPPLQLDAFSYFSDHRSTGEFALWRGNPLSSSNILNRASTLSPLIPHTMRELSTRVYPLMKTGVLSEKTAPMALDDLCDHNLSSCDSGSDSSFVVACEDAAESKLMPTIHCSIGDDRTVSLYAGPHQPETVSTKAVQTTGGDILTAEQLWQDIDLALKVLAKDWIKSHPCTVRYESKAIQCSLEVSECTAYSFCLEPAHTDADLYIKEIRQAVRKGIIEKYDSLQIGVTPNKHENISPSYEEFDDNLSTLHIEKAQYSSMLREPSMRQSTNAFSHSRPSQAASVRRAASGAPASSISPRRLPVRSSSGKTNHRNILSAWTTFRPLSNAPNERLSPRRSNNFLSARSPMHTIEQIQRSNTSASKLISKRPLPQFTVDGIVAGAIEFNPIKSAPLKNGQ